jgi:YD repeat-containing protein
LKSTFGDRTIHTAAKGEKVIFKGEEEWEVADDGAQGPGAFAARRMKAFKAPAVEAADLADKAQSLKKADGVISSDLTEAGAKSFLTFGGRRPNADAPGPKDAKGSVKFWVKDGELTKYEYNVQGKIIGRDDAEISINRTTTVEIKDVGKTKLTLPDEAKKKF